MIRKTSKNEIRERVHTRIRKKLRGTSRRPRLAVFRSVAHIYAQVIDDSKGTTLVAASSTEKSELKTGGNLAAADGKSVSAWRNALKKRASLRWCSIVVDISITGASRLWPTPPAKQDWSFNAGFHSQTRRSRGAQSEKENVVAIQPRYQGCQGR